MKKKVITIEFETNIIDSKIFIHRLIKINNEEIFDNTCNITLYSKEISPLKSFIDWISNDVSEKQVKSVKNITTQRCNFFSFIKKIWFKLFRKSF